MTRIPQHTQPTQSPNSAFERTKSGWRPPAESGLREFGKALVLACVVMAPLVGLGGSLVLGSRRERESARLAALSLSRAHSELIAAPALPTLAVSEVVKGRDLFATTCVACHGSDARGVTGLGKNLVTNNFVAAQTDDQLRQFLIEGRPNAVPVGMPPKAGRDDLTDEDLRSIVAYMRGLQDVRRMPELPAMVIDLAPSAAQKDAAMAAAGGDAELAAYIASGDKLYHSSCIACHGKAGAGIAGNGKALADNEFVRSLDDDGLLAFIKQGRSPTDKKSTTGIQMPPKGGNPAMTDDDILDVIAYLRTLQVKNPSTATGK